MKILFFGDIFGEPGREAVQLVLPQYKKKYKPDLIIANAENLAYGKGVTKSALDELLKAGIMAFTSGNHIFDNKNEGISLLEDFSYPLIRPLNYPQRTSGRGYLILDVKGIKVLILNLIGRVFVHRNYEDPLLAASKIIEKFDDIKVKFVDFHCEATSEKKVMGYYLEGRVSAVVGTHTHVMTADDYILPKGTAYITDVGMCGTKNSVIGMKKDFVIEEFLTQISQKKEIEEDGEKEISAVLIEIDEKTGKAEKISRIQEIIA